MERLFQLLVGLSHPMRCYSTWSQLPYAHCFSPPAMAGDNFRLCPNYWESKVKSGISDLY